MKILILGSGGREHALTWAVLQNPKCDHVIVAPGNAGIEEIAECIALDIENGAAIVEFSKENNIDFVIIGPENPLACGVADDLRAANILCFGPSQAAAQLESSKKFTKEICDAAQAPTARYATFEDPDSAKAYIHQHGAPIVVKADGLAAGKGVVVAMSEQEANDAIDMMFEGSFGAAGARVVIEEFMEGEEASWFILSDGTNVLPIGTAQDHKRAFDGDQGPNTGGMGAYSPAPILTDSVMEAAMDDIIKPTIAEMKKRGTPYQGVLYAGFMIKEGQARLVEYNCRFGDPECQVLMMRLGGQILDLMLATARETLDQEQVSFADDHAMTIVMAAKGYPGPYNKGTEIKGVSLIPSDSKNMVFHAGTVRADQQLLANGGRVLNITARADSLQSARNIAYQNIQSIDWPEGFYRNDIGWRSLTK